jgi:single-stranded DNA-binding protein
MLHGNNLSVLMGHLTADPDVLPTRRGNRLRLSFRIAVGRSFDQASSSGKNADFFTVVKWGDYDTIVQLTASLQKGTQVHVTGRWQSRDLADGRVVTEMVASTIVPLDHAKFPSMERRDRKR